MNHLYNLSITKLSIGVTKRKSLVTVLKELKILHCIMLYTCSENKVMPKHRKI